MYLITSTVFLNSWVCGVVLIVAAENAVQVVVGKGLYNSILLQDFFFKGWGLSPYLFFFFLKIVKCSRPYFSRGFPGAVHFSSPFFPRPSVVPIADGWVDLGKFVVLCWYRTGTPLRWASSCFPNFCAEGIIITWRHFWFNLAAPSNSPLSYFHGWQGSRIFGAGAVVMSSFHSLRKSGEGG